MHLASLRWDYALPIHSSACTVPYSHAFTCGDASIRADDRNCPSRYPRTPGPGRLPNVFFAMIGIKVQVDCELLSPVPMSVIVS